MNSLFEDSIADLCSDDPVVRRAAARRLGPVKVGRLSASMLLVQALNDWDVTVRKVAATSMAIGLRPPEAIPTLRLHALSDSDARVRSGCLLVLWRMARPEFADVYRQALKDDELDNFLTASLALCDLGDSGPLIAAAHHPRWDIRKDVCNHLIRRKLVTDKIVEVLEELKKDPDAIERDRHIKEHRAWSIQETGEPLHPKWRERTVPELLRAAKRIMRSRDW